MNYIWVFVIIGGLAAIVVVYQLVDHRADRREPAKSAAIPVPAPQAGPAIKANLETALVSNNKPQEDKAPIPSVARKRRVNGFSGVPSSNTTNTTISDNSAPDNQSLSLHELVKIAYRAKEEQNDAAAFNAFLQALKLYPESLAAPYFVIEIGTLLKSQGAYDAAINLFSEGRNLPATLQNPILDQEFVQNIAYLRIAKNILLERMISPLPLHQLPADIMAEIDHEFAEWSVMA